jgi:putative ABC transport system substrate-binding protein
VVSSSKIDPYQQTIAGFAEAVGRERPLKVSKRYVGREGAGIQHAVANQRPDLILALGTPALAQARAEAGGIPVIFCLVSNPEPLMDSAQVSGVSIDIPAELKLQAMKRVLPKARRMGIIYTAESAFAYHDALRAAPLFNLDTVERQVSSERELPAALRQVLPKVDFFLMVPDPALCSIESTEHLLLEGLRSRVPVIGLSAPYCKGGALISFECDYRDLGRQAGELASRVLDGESLESRLVPPRRFKFP